MKFTPPPIIQYGFAMRIFSHFLIILVFGPIPNLYKDNHVCACVHLSTFSLKNFSETFDRIFSSHEVLSELLWSLTVRCCPSIHPSVHIFLVYTLASTKFSKLSALELENLPYFTLFTLASANINQPAPNQLVEINTTYRICYELTVEIKTLNESWKMLLSEPSVSLITFFKTSLI